MNFTKVFLIALIASLSTSLTLRFGFGSTGGWFIMPMVFAILAGVSHHLGGGSVIDFFKK